MPPIVPGGYVSAVHRRRPGRPRPEPADAAARLAPAGRSPGPQAGHHGAQTVGADVGLGLEGEMIKGADREKILSDNAEAAYYAGKVLASQFFIGYEFPEYFGKLDTILGGEAAVIKASRSIFTGAPEE